MNISKPLQQVGEKGDDFGSFTLLPLTPWIVHGTWSEKTKRELLSNPKKQKRAAMDKIYAGMRKENGYYDVNVVENGNSRELPMRLDLKVCVMPPDDFPDFAAQLALAILADASGDDALAVKMLQPFKRRVIGRLDPKKDWELSHRVVMAALRDL